MARKQGSNKINLWLAEQSEEEEKAFRLFARKSYHSKPAIMAYLADRGCMVGLSTVYAWVGDNVQPGEQADLFNQANEEYAGVELLSAMEKLFVKVTRISQKFVEVVEQEPDLSIEQIVNALPAYARESRTLALQISSMKNRMDSENLILTGAMRAIEIVLGATGVRDTAEEEWIRSICEKAVLQIREELSSKATIG